MQSHGLLLTSLTIKRDGLRGNTTDKQSAATNMAQCLRTQFVLPS